MGPEASTRTSAAPSYARRVFPDDVARWLIAQPRDARPIEAIVDALASRLAGGGIPLWRLSTALVPFDPTVVGPLYSWLRGQGTKTLRRTHEILETPAYLGSPARRVLSTGEE